MQDYNRTTSNGDYDEAGRKWTLDYTPSLEPANGNTTALALVRYDANNQLYPIQPPADIRVVIGRVIFQDEKNEKIGCELVFNRSQITVNLELHLNKFC